MVHCHIHSSSQLVPILSQANPVHTTPSVLSSHLPLGLPSGSFPLAFLAITFFFPVFPIHATFLAHLLDFIIVIVLATEYKPRSSSLYSFLHSTVTSSLFGPNIQLSNMFSNALSLCSSIHVGNQVSQASFLTLSSAVRKKHYQS
jgi:hypothetical protein